MSSRVSLGAAAAAAAVAVYQLLLGRRAAPPQPAPPPTMSAVVARDNKCTLQQGSWATPSPGAGEVRLTSRSLAVFF